MKNLANFGLELQTTVQSRQQLEAQRQENLGVQEVRVFHQTIGAMSAPY
jgi:hypothetical protein